MNKILAGFAVDEELYNELVIRHYDIAPDWRNVPLKTVILSANSKDFEKNPELQKKCQEIAEQIKEEIKKYYLARDGRKEYVSMKHKDFIGYVQDVQKIQYDMGMKAKSARNVVENAREKWKRASNEKGTSEVFRVKSKSEYLQAEEDHKNTMRALYDEMKGALDRVEVELQKHLEDFYSPNGSRIDETVMKLVNSEFPFKKEEFVQLISGYTDNPTMIRLLDRFSEKNDLRTEQIEVLGYYAKQGGMKELEIFNNLRDFAMLVVDVKEPVSVYQSRFEQAVENAVVSLNALPIRPLPE